MNNQILLVGFDGLRPEVVRFSGISRPLLTEINDRENEIGEKVT